MAKVKIATDVGEEVVKEVKVSATRMNTFLQCKGKYWFGYKDKLPKLDNPVFRLGTTVHETLEFAGHILQEANRTELTKAEKTLVIDEYRRQSVKNGIEDMDIHNQGLDMVKRRLEDFMGEARKILSLEVKFGFDKNTEVITPSGVPVLGAMDKVLELDDDTILVTDYKTSKTAPTPDQLKSDKQLSMYDLVASMKYPGKRIIVALDLLKHDILYSYRTTEERSEFDKYLKLVYDAMCSLKKSEVTYSLNTFCPWCDYREACDAYKAVLTKTNGKFQEVHLLNDDQLYHEWKTASENKKIFEMRDRELSMVIIDRIKNSGKSIELAGNEVYIRQNARKEYDLDKVRKIIPKDDLPNLVSLHKKSLEAYLEDNVAIKQRVLEAMTVNYTTPFLASRKLKVKKEDL